MTRLDRITPWIGVGALALAIVAWALFPFPEGRRYTRDLLAVWLGVAVLGFTWWRAATARTGTIERRYALPVGVAAVGMLVAPMIGDTQGLAPLLDDFFETNGPALERLPSLALQAFLAPTILATEAWPLVVMGTSLPLARTLSADLPPGHAARWTRRAMVGLAVALIVVAALWSWVWRLDDLRTPAIWAIASAITALPAAVIAGHLWHTGRDAAVPTQRRLAATATYLAIGAAPAVAGTVLLSDRWYWLLIPLGAALVAAFIVVRVAVVPLWTLAGAAVTQRDLVVTAAESERVRLAAELHDGPLADLSLLIQDLDDRRDRDGAASARAIAADLRAIGSDLRLPILDDLGVGPALDWLVTRSVQRFGEQISLELDATERLPAGVELAVYRIAQEAIRNAIEHGSAPVTVRYHADAASATLEVDDTGPGLDEAARARALDAGRLGLVSMAQRAETIGAQLTLTGRPGGGTRVRLAWTAPTTPG